MFEFKPFSVILLVLSISLPPSLTAENVYKCTNSEGTPTFQNTPCFSLDPSSRQERIKINPSSGSGRSTTTGESYRVETPNSIRAQDGKKYRIPSENWDSNSAPQPQVPDNNSDSTNINHYPSPEVSCAELESELKYIQKQLRQGYSGSSGERLKSRRRYIEDIMWGKCK